MFAELEKGSVRKVRRALAKVKGVDSKATKARTKRGEISVKLKGDAKVTTADILKALKDAGIEASIKKPKKSKE